MDLLVEPGDPAFPTKDAPFVCEGHNPWDCGSFTTYPARTGKMNVIPWAARESLPELHGQAEYEWREAERNNEAFFQTWLVFGLMAEFLGLNELPDGQRLVPIESAREELEGLIRMCQRDEGGEKILLGLPFLSRPERIVERLRKVGTQEKQKQRVLYITRCLTIARTVSTYAQLGPNIETRYSIAALGECLVYTLHHTCYAAKLLVPIDPNILTSWAMTLTTENLPLWKDMIRVGWCPGELVRFRQVFNRIYPCHYASRMKLTASRRRWNHSDCTESGCVAAQIRQGEYRLTHVQEGCSCDLASINARLSTNILQSGDGTFPVLNLTPLRDGTGNVEALVEEWTPEVPYIALSHVWADGLGNPTANSLQSCQLARLGRLVTSLRENVQGNTTPQCRVWVDTLCVPIGGPGYTIAMTRMAHVYQQATHVLVLDSSLSCLKFGDLNGPERYLRIFTSPWMTRVWTLQEGALNESLYFQFADRAVGVQELRFMVEKDGMENRLGTLCERVRDLFDGLQVVRPKDDEVTKDDLPHVSRLLGQLSNAIRYRALSVASDEALCLATFLEIDIQPILHSDIHEERMRALWALTGQKYGGVPAEMIFFMGHDTLGFRGWRWAPRSLLLSGSDATWTIQDRLCGYKAPQIGRIRSQGLEVRFPGWQISCRPWDPDMRLDTWEHLSARPHYPVVMRDSSTKHLWMMSLNLHGTPATLPDVSLRHILSQSSDFVLLRSTGLPKPMTILARPRDTNISLSIGRSEAPVEVEFLASVHLTELFDVGQAFYEPLIALAAKSASHASSIDLSRLDGYDDPAGGQASANVKEHMQKITIEHLQGDLEYQKLALRFLDKGEELANLWEAIPIVLPFEITFEHLPDDQYWIVD